MRKRVDYKNLKEAINLAEESLKNYSKKKREKLKKEIEHGYELLNSSSANQREVDTVTKNIIYILDKESSNLISGITLSSFFLASALVFTGYQTFSFIDTVLNNNNIKIPEINQNLSKLVSVNYVETNIVDLKNQVPVDDNVGLLNKPQKFSISNNYENKEQFDYKIKYQVNIKEFGNFNNVLDKKYIKYQLTYTDENNNKIKTPINTFDKLHKNSDNSYEIFNGIQEKNAKTNFEVVIWIDASADNSEQNKEYHFMFDVNAIIENI